MPCNGFSGARYRVGCAGQFMFGMTSTYADRNEAIAACGDGPTGCEVLDQQTGEWIGPTCWEEIEEARAALPGEQSSP